MQFIRKVKSPSNASDCQGRPVPFCELGWRTVGCRLDDAMQGSDQEVYYSLLCEVIRRCEEDKERIKPSQKELPSPPIVMAEEEGKVIDLTHRGAGL
jgi:hypothetical protein